ncbi:MAG: DUF4159 domain-containing protein [Gemmatimonadetes bacterium]|nr:DUF4159 domain-containing protein [Gemmatimonadota bacterium]
MRRRSNGRSSTDTHFHTEPPPPLPHRFFAILALVSATVAGIAVFTAHREGPAPPVAESSRALGAGPAGAVTQWSWNGIRERDEAPPRPRTTFSGGPGATALADGLASAPAGFEPISAQQGPPHRRMYPGELPGRYPFYWTRAIYSGWGRGWRGQSWAIDYPKGDQQFILVLKRLVRLDAYDWDNAVRLDDPDLRRFPVLYAVEVGGMELTQPEVEGLRAYLDAGGFLIVDDFWGDEWFAWEHNIRRVYPDRPIVDIGLDHPIYSAYYDITEIKQVPARGRGIYGRPTEECYGCYPAVRGIYDDDGRLMVVINWNTDLGDAWEWAEDPSYPLEYSTYAYEMGANMIVYAMSH